jgi:hypothetical protein
MNQEQGYFWPTPEQELLLKASLLTGKDATTAWKNWAAAINFDLLDTGSQRLLPLLYKNLVEHGIQHPAIQVYKGFYRMTWYKNNLLSRRITGVLSLLDSHGIPSILLKGAALVVLYYKDWALRPMSDFDVLVPEEDALKTIDLLYSSGWKPADLKPGIPDLQTTHACTLVDASGTELDLHWWIMHETGMAEVDASFKSAAMQIDFNGIRTCALSHTDQLFHILAHGSRWNEIAPMRWIPDALMILREAGMHIDWGRLLDESRRRYMVLPIQKTLLYIYEVFDAPVPADTMRLLTKMKPLMSERLEFRMQGRPRGIIRDILYLWFTYVRTSRTSGMMKLVFGFPSFLRKFWKVPENIPMTGFLFRRLVQRIQK